MKITGIKEYSTKSLSKKEIADELSSKYGLDVSHYFDRAPLFNGGEEVESIKIVDVEYDSNVKSITSSNNHTVQMPTHIS